MGAKIWNSIKPELYIKKEKKRQSPLNILRHDKNYLIGAYNMTEKKNITNVKHWFIFILCRQIHERSKDVYV